MTLGSKALFAAEPKPVDALLLYLCVNQARMRGGSCIPATRNLARLLRVIESSANNTTVRQVAEPAVQSLWEDLKWVSDSRLSLREIERAESDYFCDIGAATINTKLNQLTPYIVKAGKKKRHIDTDKLVERPPNALRLVAFKDAYFVCRDIPHDLVCKLFLEVSLVRDELDFYTFVVSMLSVDYLTADPPAPTNFDSDIQTRRFVLEPGPAFRSQDLYLELRALDEFPKRNREMRLRLNGRIREFVSKHSLQYRVTGA